MTCENCAATLAELTTERDRLREALEKIVKLAADREAFMLLGPRAFAQAERIARAALAPDAARIAWQCSGCLWGFPDPWQKTCPACGREGYWSGSVHPSAKPWAAPDTAKES